MPETLIFTCWNEGAHPDRNVASWTLTEEEADAQKIVSCPTCHSCHKVVHSRKG